MTASFELIQSIDSIVNHLSYDQVLAMNSLKCISIWSTEHGFIIVSPLLNMYSCTYRKSQSDNRLATTGFQNQSNEIIKPLRLFAHRRRDSAWINSTWLYCGRSNNLKFYENIEERYDISFKSLCPPHFRRKEFWQTIYRNWRLQNFNLCFFFWKKIMLPLQKTNDCGLLYNKQSRSNIYSHIFCARLLTLSKLVDLRSKSVWLR